MVVGPHPQGFRAKDALNRLRGKALTVWSNYQESKSSSAKEKQEKHVVR